MSFKYGLLLIAASMLGACGGDVDNGPGDEQDSTVDEDTATGGDTTITPTDTSITPTDTTITDSPPVDSTGTDGIGVDTFTPPTDTAPDVIAPVDGACPTGLIICGGACVDSTSDSNNCGACGTRCGSAGTCVSGKCTCAAGSTTCGTPPTITCADVTKDPLNCGGCGRRCSSFGTCTASSCSCPAGTAICSTGGPGGATACTDTSADSNHCGTTGCGTTCSDREYCDGTSKCACKPGLTSCTITGAGPTCLNTAGSPLACGGCGTVCTAAQVCVSGVCQPTATACPTGTMRCSVTGGLAGCYDTSKDPTHCGSCTNICNQDELCIAGVCREFTPAPTCTTCPCADCGTFFSGGGTSAICCPKLTGHKSPICVRGPACPG